MADNVSIVRSGYEAFAKGDIPTVLGLWDPKIEWNEPEHGTYWTGAPLHGGQEVINGVFAHLAKDFDGFRIEIRRIVGSGDTVLVEGRARGTAKATGKPLDAQVAHVWEVRDGKAIRVQEYADTWQFAQVTGNTPKN
ncbi:MAG: nuclear transport factor 2 family protein [Gammaproteobacteria bacterium]|nr:nuclear transport factor 2 family protein [Gammaproteobacteria bacterium]